MLQIHNSLTGRKEAFQPLTPGEVRMYVCGITVYDLCHIGHARSAIVFDVLVRYLVLLAVQDNRAKMILAHQHQNKIY